jgi:prepilin-type N-terminal cleavage/methylation domain-containing protein
VWEMLDQKKNKGFTVIELLVTIGIIAALSGIGVVSVSKVRSAKNQTMCINNLRSISQGLQMYYNDYMAFPDDGYPDDSDDTYPLSTELENYIHDKSTFICPEDSDATSTGSYASYDPYYVARKGSYDSNELALGCPRHRGAKNSTSAFFTGSTEIMNIGVVKVNGQELPPDGTTAQRTISSQGEKMTFDDDSTVEIKNNSGGSYGCFLVQSVRLADGTLYSIVRVQDNEL